MSVDHKRSADDAELETTGSAEKKVRKDEPVVYGNPMGVTDFAGVEVILNRGQNMCNIRRLAQSIYLPASVLQIITDYESPLLELMFGWMVSLNHQILPLRRIVDDDEDGAPWTTNPQQLAIWRTSLDEAKSLLPIKNSWFVGIIRAAVRELLPLTDRAYVDNLNGYFECNGDFHQKRGTIYLNQKTGLPCQYTKGVMIQYYQGATIYHDGLLTSVPNPNPNNEGTTVYHDGLSTSVQIPGREFELFDPNSRSWFTGQKPGYDFDLFEPNARSWHTLEQDSDLEFPEDLDPVFCVMIRAILTVVYRLCCEIHLGCPPFA